MASISYIYCDDYLKEAHFLSVQHTIAIIGLRRSTNRSLSSHSRNSAQASREHPMFECNYYALTRKLLIFLLLVLASRSGNTQITPPTSLNGASAQAVAYDSRPLNASLLPLSLQGFLATTDSSSPEYVLFSAMWRTDGGFHSTIRMKNVLVVDPLHVTPVLYMADGTEYTLPPVTVPVSGVATLDINAAVANAPLQVAGHISEYGSIALKYRYPSTGHLAASVAVIDALRSLSFTFPFVEPGAMQMLNAPDSEKHHHAESQTLEGLWWKHDAGVTGFVTLTNPTVIQQQATVEIAGSLEHRPVSQNIRLCAHCTQVLDLAEALKDVPDREQQAGSVRVRYAKMGDVLVGGGLLNENEGYSANIPFWPHDLTSLPTAITYASVGIMTGKPDPMNGFPSETIFAPYLSLRNASSKTLEVGMQINYMNGSNPTTLSLPSQDLLPMEARQIDMHGALAHVGLIEFNGAINVAVSFTGKPGDLIMASGSVDQTGTYVFEVEPQGTGTSEMKFNNYWSVTDGNDTMYSLWNPSSAAQDLTLTFYYGDGNGKYVLPMHLAAEGSAMIDMKELVAQHTPDAAGNVIPFTVQQGSLTIANAKGYRDQMTIVISAGIFNVADATCGTSCINCCGNSNFADTPGDGFLCNVGESMTFGTTAIDCSGNTVSFSGSWWSDNTSYATMSASTMTGQLPGAVNIYDSLSGIIVYSGQMCSPYPSCPSGNPQPGSSGSVVPTFTINPKSYVFVGTDPQFTYTNKVFVSADNPPGGSLSASSSDTNDTFTIGSSSGLPWALMHTPDVSTLPNDRTVYLTYTVNSKSTVHSISLTARQFAFASNAPLTNSCPSNAHGYHYDIVYTPITHPDYAPAPSDGSVGGVAATESFSAPLTCSQQTQDTFLAEDGTFTDTLALCSSNPLPACNQTVDQFLNVAGSQVRKNTLTWTNTSLTYTNYGPFN